MVKIKVQKQDDYSIIANNVLWDKRLSPKARFLLIFCISLADGWEYSVDNLAAATGAGKQTVASGIQELEKFGYITRQPRRNTDGSFDGMDYVIKEQPEPVEATAMTENPMTENPMTENPMTENPMTVENSENKQIRGEKAILADNAKGSFAGIQREKENEKEKESIPPTPPMKEKEKVKEKEKAAAAAYTPDPTLCEAYDVWEHSIGLITPRLAELIADLVRETGIRAFTVAVDKAVRANARSFRYIQAAAKGIASGNDFDRRRPFMGKRNTGGKNDAAAGMAEALRILGINERRMA